MTLQQKRLKMKELRNRLTTRGLELIKADPWVPIRLADDKVYRLEFSWAAAVEVFRETGININLGQLDMNKIMHMEVFPALLHAGLFVHHEKDLVVDGEPLTQDELMFKVNPRYMVYYATCITQALEAIQPDQQEMEDIISELEATAKEVPEAPLAMMNISSSSGADVELSDAPI